MLNAKVELAINEQINAELYSAYLYYAMANHLESLSLPGAAHWMRMQAIEEMSHVAKFAAYLNDRRGQVKLAAIEAPPVEWESALAIFEAAYEHEIKVTGRINALVDTALQNSDHATVNFLQWFVGEQVEEEASADQVVQQLKLVDRSEGGLFMLDKELGARPLALPPELTGGGA